jgi:hypothetical protein
VFPLGHLAVGYLAFLGYRYVSARDLALPALPILIALAVGTQVPDLIDKPLAHWGVLVSGRSLGHSLLFVVPFSGVVWQVATRFQRRELGTAFLVGVFSHLPADSYRALLRADWADMRHLLYPVTTPIDFSGDEVSPLLRIVRYYTDPTWNVEMAVIGLALALVVWQLLPGLADRL